MASPTSNNAQPNQEPDGSSLGTSTLLNMGAVASVGKPSAGQIVSQPSQAAIAATTPNPSTTASSSLGMSSQPNVPGRLGGKVITYTPAPSRHSSAVEQPFRKSLALCAVLPCLETRYKRAH